MIKFRAWDIWNKRWLNNFNISSDGKVKVYDNRYTFEEADGVFEVVQSTGLTDINGKEIYEGDIVHWNVTFTDPTDNKEVTIDMKVPIRRKSDGSWGLGAFGNKVYDNLEHVEVLGNIYENDDLLNSRMHN